MSEITEILDRMLTRARRWKKRMGLFYALKALVILGKDWHTFSEVLTEMMEISKNPKLKYYPIQDAIKYKLAILDKQVDGSAGNLRVKLRDELFDIIAETIDDYIRTMEQEISND